MFNSNQKLNINGESKTDLNNALTFALKLASDNRQPSYYTVKDGAIYLFWNKPSTSELEFIHFPSFATLDSVVQTVWDYLKSGDAKEAHTEVQDDIDGSVSPGWEIFLPTYNDLKNIYWYDCVGVKLAWIYYAKSITSPTRGEA